MARTICTPASFPSIQPAAGIIASLNCYSPVWKHKKLFSYYRAHITKSFFLPRLALSSQLPHPDFPPFFLPKALREFVQASVTTQGCVTAKGQPRSCPNNRPKQGILNNPESQCLNPRQEYFVKSLLSINAMGTPLPLKYQQAWESHPHPFSAEEHYLNTQWMWFAGTPVDLAEKYFRINSSHYNRDHYIKLWYQPPASWKIQLPNMTHNRYHPSTSLELNQEIKEQFNYRFIGSGYITAVEEQLEINNNFKTVTEFAKGRKRACCVELGRQRSVLVLSHS